MKLKFMFGGFTALAIAIAVFVAVDTDPDPADADPVVAPMITD